MSVMTTLRVSGDGNKLEEYAARDKSVFNEVSERAKAHGCIHHAFYASDDEILVVDEWPDEASFQAFFSASPEIPGVMADLGVTSQPTITFWRRLESRDDF